MQESIKFNIWNISIIAESIVGLEIGNKLVWLVLMLKLAKKNFIGSYFTLEEPNFVEFVYFLEQIIISRKEKPAVLQLFRSVTESIVVLTF